MADYMGEREIRDAISHVTVLPSLITCSVAENIASLISLSPAIKINISIKINKTETAHTSKGDLSLLIINKAKKSGNNLAR